MARILFLLEDYNLFYTHGTNKLKQKNANVSYNDTLNALIAEKYYQSDSMASAFTGLGHETKIVVPEANPLQLQWAKENKKIIYYKWLAERPIRSYKSRVLKQYRNSYNSIQFEVLFEQIKEFKPDVVYVYSNIFLTEAQVLKIKTFCKKIVLQWAAPLFNEKLNFPYHAFDLIVTAAIQLKEYFESKGYKVAYSQQAFDDSILEKVDNITHISKKNIVFIGSFSPNHQYRFEVIESLLQKGLDITIYGIGKESLPANSLIKKVMNPPLFGIDMYNEYRKYSMALHIHITGQKSDNVDWDKYAGAKRLFEITGIGTMLLTPYQENIEDIFIINEEVVTFTTADDLLDKIDYFCKHPNEAAAISARGMKRTLSQHSFTARAKELGQILFETKSN